MTGARAFDARASVVSVSPVPGGAFRAVLRAPEIARCSKPLQFVNVKIGDGPHPFLRRPFSLSDMRVDQGLIEITWAAVGEGSLMMTNWEPGTPVRVLGPLGNGFVPCDARDFTVTRPPRMILIAGGTGLAPMYPLAAFSVNLGHNARLLYGARSGDAVMDTGRFIRAGCPVQIATEDGSLGLKGRVTDLLASVLGDLGPGDTVVACGPVPMLRAVKSLLCGRGAGEKRIPLFVSLESRMACGTGLCKGCAVPASEKDPQGAPVYLHVCTDGPVFDAGSVDLEGVFV